MIGHNHVHYIIGSALRHVALYAVLRRTVAAGVARAARLRGRPAVPVGIVTRQAGETPALAKTGRLQQPVGRVRDLEFVVVSSAGRVVEMQDVICQRLPRPVREKAASVAPDRIRQAAAGRLQVTLKTYLELPFAAEPGRIEDRITPRLFGVRATG